MSCRFSGICQQLKERLTNNSIVALFEIDATTRDKLIQLAQENQWLVLSGSYNPSPNSFHYMVFSSSPDIKFGQSELLPLTLSGKLYDGPRDKSSVHLLETLGEEFEKGIFKVPVTIHNNSFDLFIVHLGLRNDSRILQTQKLQQYVKESKKAMLIGDFNCFDSSNKEPALFEKQLDMLIADGFLHVSNMIKSTFDNRSFPYDLQFKMSDDDKAEYAKLSTAIDTDDSINAFHNFLESLPKKYSTEGIALDHVFTKGINCTVKAESFTDLSDHSLLTVIL
jgi:hypothetical protein